MIYFPSQQWPNKDWKIEIMISGNQLKNLLPINVNVDLVRCFQSSKALVSFFFENKCCGPITVLKIIEWKIQPDIFKTPVEYCKLQEKIVEFWLIGRRPWIKVHGEWGGVQFWGAHQNSYFIFSQLENLQWWTVPYLRNRISKSCIYILLNLCVCMCIWHNFRAQRSFCNFFINYCWGIQMTSRL